MWIAPPDRRLAAIALPVIALLAIVVPEALAQAGGGSSGFSGGGGGGGGGSSGSGGGGGGFSGGGGGFSGDGGSGGSDGSAGIFEILFFVFIALMAFGVPAIVRKRWKTVTARRSNERERHERDEEVTTASAEAAEDDPAFAATAVKQQAAALYVEVQQAWSTRDDDALQRLLGEDLLTEWRRRLADFERRGWVNEVSIRRGPKIDYVDLVNREGEQDDRVTVAITAKLHSVVRTSAGQVITRDVDDDGDGVIDVSEYWTLARTGASWRLVSIEQEHEGRYHLAARIIAAPWSDDRLSDQSLVELASADAPAPDVGVSELVSCEFDGTAREKALDLALADPRCAPDVLEAAARRTVDAWAEAVDGDDAALLEVASADAAHDLLYPYGAAQPRARIVVRGPRLLRLSIAALHTDREPPRMQVEAHLRGHRYIEDRDTVALLAGSKEDEIEFTERWMFALDGRPDAPWRLVGGAAPGGDH